VALSWRREDASACLLPPSVLFAQSPGFLIAHSGGKDAEPPCPDMIEHSRSGRSERRRFPPWRSYFPAPDIRFLCYARRDGRIKAASSRRSDPPDQLHQTHRSPARRSRWVLPHGADESLFRRRNWGRSRDTPRQRECGALSKFRNSSPQILNMLISFRPVIKRHITSALYGEDTPITAGTLASPPPK